MPDLDTKSALRRDKAVAAAIRSWRALTGGTTTRDSSRRTLIACSGGADSSALALALAAAAPASIALAHIVHDLRPADQSLADRDAVKALAARLNIPFLESSVHVRAHKGNPEAVARRLRYRELARLASPDFPFLATAHHADDQLETILMRLLRGSGPLGLAGIRPSRPLADIRLIRPILSLTREDCERICSLAGYAWREDATNLDTTRLRAALRINILPKLRALAPKAAHHATTSASLLADASDLINRQAAALLAQAARTTTSYAWPRSALRAESPLILGTTLRQAAAALNNNKGLDRLSWRLIRPVLNAIHDSSTEPRQFAWRGVEVRVTAQLVQIATR